MSIICKNHIIYAGVWPRIITNFQYISYTDTPMCKMQNYTKNWLLCVTVAMVIQTKNGKIANLTYFEATQ